MSLLSKTRRAPFGFFVSTDVGNITNRFGQDMELIDMTLPLAALNAVFCTFFTDAWLALSGTQTNE
jgi:ATP-binding cassette subfamily C (CFTR/MRP) protein 1